MVRIGMVTVVGGILVALGVLLFMYTENSTNLIHAEAGDTVRIGPVEYVLTFEGTHEGNKELQPEHTFVTIGIVAKNIGNEKTLLSGGQFLIVDPGLQKSEPIYGEFSSKDLLLEWLEPNKPVEKTTQFDIEFDESKQYKILLRSHKDQTSSEIAQICILNCN